MTAVVEHEEDYYAYWCQACGQGGRGYPERHDAYLEAEDHNEEHHGR